MIDVNEVKINALRKILEPYTDKEKQYQKCLEIIKQKCWNVVKDERLRDYFLKRFVGDLIEKYEQNNNSITTLVNIYTECVGKLSGSAKNFATDISKLIELTGISRCAFCKYEILPSEKNRVTANRRYHPTCYHFMKSHTQNPTKKSREGKGIVV